MMKLTVIMPVFNEQGTVEKVLDSLLELELSGWEKEIIVVDDCSTDKTKEKLKHYHKKNQIVLVSHSQNKGKGRAIKSGIEKASGDYVIIQDADLEYNPRDINRLVNIARNNPETAVYGSRFLGKNEAPRTNVLGIFSPLSCRERNPSEAPLSGAKGDKDTVFGHRAGNLFLTVLTNLLYRSRLSDMETCYKLIPRKLLNSVRIESQRFNFEPEITAKLLKRKVKIIEVPISYHKRGFSQGKKIKWFKDGWSAVFTLVKYRFVS